MKRVVLIVLDSVGAGELPDAAQYGDSGANTLGNTVSSVINNAVNQAKSSANDIFQNPQKTKNKIFF